MLSKISQTQKGKYVTCFSSYAGSRIYEGMNDRKVEGLYKGRQGISKRGTVNKKVMRNKYEKGRMTHTHTQTGIYINGIV